MGDFEGEGLYFDQSSKNIIQRNPAKLHIDSFVIAMQRFRIGGEK